MSKQTVIRIDTKLVDGVLVPVKVLKPIVVKEKRVISCKARRSYGYVVAESRGLVLRCDCCNKLIDRKMERDGGVCVRCL